MPAGVAALDVGDFDVLESTLWLQRIGFAQKPMGIPEGEATVWYTWDPHTLAMSGVGALSAAFVVVDRRRPTV